jgi:hypothetical protein
MKKTFATLAALGVLKLLASGQSSSHEGSSRHNELESRMSTHDEHGGSHDGHPGFKLEFKNDSVQVVRITIGPHEQIPMHDVTPRVVVLLTDQDLKLTFPNGESREEHHKAGESMWVSGGRHIGENLSDRPIEFIAVIPQRQ